MSRDLTKEEIDDLRASFEMFDKDKSGEFPWAEGWTRGGHGSASLDTWTRVFLPRRLVDLSHLHLSYLLITSMIDTDKLPLILL